MTKNMQVGKIEFETPNGRIVYSLDAILKENFRLNKEIFRLKELIKKMKRERDERNKSR